MDQKSDSLYEEMISNILERMELGVSEENDTCLEHLDPWDILHYDCYDYDFKIMEYMDLEKIFYLIEKGIFIDCKQSTVIIIFVMIILTITTTIIFKSSPFIVVCS